MGTRLVKKLKQAVKEAPYGEKPKGVKTHLRNCIVTPEMVGSVCEVYGGKYWTPVEVKADMCGKYLGEFSLTYKPIRHGKVGHGATRGSKFTPSDERVVLLTDSFRHAKRLPRCSVGKE